MYYYYFNIDSVENFSVNSFIDLFWRGWLRTFLPIDFFSENFSKSNSITYYKREKQIGLQIDTNSNSSPPNPNSHFIVSNNFLFLSKQPLLALSCYSTKDLAVAMSCTVTLQKTISFSKSSSNQFLVTLIKEEDKKENTRSSNEFNKCKLVNYDSLPDFLKHNEFVVNYYRSEWPLKQTILSIFSIHNETLNIWT